MGQEPWGIFIDIHEVLKCFRAGLPRHEKSTTRPGRRNFGVHCMFFGLNFYSGFRVDGTTPKMSFRWDPYKPLFGDCAIYSQSTVLTQSQIIFSTPRLTRPLQTNFSELAQYMQFALGLSFLPATVGKTVDHDHDLRERPPILKHHHPHSSTVGVDHGGLVVTPDPTTTEPPWPTPSPSLNLPVQGLITGGPW